MAKIAVFLMATWGWLQNWAKFVKIPNFTTLKRTFKAWYKNILAFMDNTDSPGVSFSPSQHYTVGEFFSIHLESEVIDRCPNRRRCSQSMPHLCSLNWTSQQCLWCWCLLLCFRSGKWNSSTLFVCKVYECNLLVLAYNLALHPTWHPKSRVQKSQGMIS